MQLNEEGIQWELETEKGTLLWKNIFKIKENKKTILVYESSILIHIISKRTSADNFVIETFLAEIRRKQSAFLNFLLMPHYYRIVCITYRKMIGKKVNSKKQKHYRSIRIISSIVSL